MKKLLLVIAMGSLMSGCATELAMGQKQELSTYENKGLMVEEKHPGVGAALGLLPGGGSFYTRHYVLGVTNLIFWPLSILWDPYNGYQSAQTINYYSTKASVERAKSVALRQIDRDLEDKKFTYEEHIRKQREIEDKYTGY